MTAARNTDGDLRIASPRVAVVGGGHWGKNIVRNFSELGALEMVVDANADLARALVGQFGGKAGFFEDALADPKIDGIAIAAPATVHAQLAMRALGAGKHVYVEKPLALDLSDARAIVDLAAQKNLRLMVGHLLQYHPVFRKLKEIVSSGTLGRLQYIYSNRLSLGQIRGEEDVLWSFAPHDFSMILGLIGEEPEAVDAVGSYVTHAQRADYVTSHLTFRSGVRAHVLVSWLHPFKEHRLTVVGSEGAAVFEDSEPEWGKKLMLYKHGMDWRSGGVPIPKKAEPVAVEVERGEPLRSECMHFLDCIATGRQPLTDGKEGLQVLSVLTRASKALSQRMYAREPAVAPAVTEGPVAAYARRFPGTRIHESAYIDDNVEIGEGTSIWHFSHVLGRVKIGRNCVIGQNVVIGPDVTVGNRCKVQNNVSLYRGVTLEEGVFCGPSCVFTNVNNPRAEIERKSEFRPTLVKRGCTIGANATIVCGHDLGEYSFVAAGAVVTKDVPAFALVAGNPARRIGWMSENGDRLGPDLVCPGTGVKYRETERDRLEKVSS
jgi:predicted dehydrogenase/acetyltransferase-like isoleucine patch superfamily enzyme